VVENFSQGGSSLFHGYKHFINNYKKFDKIIFTITAPGRLYTDIPASELCICNTFVVEHLLSLTDIKEHIYYDVIKAAEQYYIYLQNTEFDSFVHDSIIEKIIKLAEEENINLILLPSMTNSSSSNLFKFCKQDFDLSSINNLERKFYNIPHNGMHFERKDRLQNHISDENNAILADLIKKIINEEDIQLDISLFDECPKTNPSIYYNMEEIQKL